jgi:hypothetical protein
VITVKKVFLCVWFLSAGFLFAQSPGPQTTLNDGAYPLSSLDSIGHGSSGVLDPHIIPQEPPGPILNKGTELNSRNAFYPIPCCALNHMAVHDVGVDFRSDVIKKDAANVGTDPFSADNNQPPTLRVRTAALLELHAMRQSAVGLCIQLPAKYRKHLPQCADIFRHEIRLQDLAKYSQ